MSVFLVPIAGVIVKRGAMKITPEVGVPFEFTEEEAEKFLASPTPVVRKLAVEVAPEPTLQADPKPARKSRKPAAEDDL